MNLVDVAIVCFTLFYAYKGYKQGLISVIFSLLSIILSLYLAFVFYTDIGFYIKKVFNDLNLYNLVSFVIIFIASNYLINRLRYILERMLDKLYLSIVNRFLGAVINFLKGTLIACVVLFVVSGFSYNSSFSSLLQHSKISPVLLSSFNRLVRLVNESLPGDIKRQWSKYEKKLDRLIK